MTQESSNDKTVFHFSRIRKKGEPVFFDPATDLRQLVPNIVLTVFSQLEQEFEETPLMHDILYMHNCFSIFQLRILEDITALDKQMTEFFQAIQKASPQAQALVFQRSIGTMLMIYALFCRRDSASDNNELHAMLENVRLMPYKELLSTNTYEQIKRELSSIVSFTLQTVVNNGSVAYCEETGEYLERLKERASKYINCSGPNDWNSVAAACDKAFSTTDIKSTEDKVALALAYPSYQQPCMGVEVTSDATRTCESK